MKISKRLNTIADMIEPNSRVIDVGCDHGLLSIYLDLEKNCSCLASDVNSNALESAKSNIVKYNSKNVETYLTDGIDNIDINKKLTRDKLLPPIVKISLASCPFIC